MTHHDIVTASGMAVHPTRIILLLALVFTCGYWIPAARSWEALDPFLLCGFAMLGALIAGPASLEPRASWRQAAAWGAGGSLLVITAVIITVNHVVKPPRLLLPPMPVLLRTLLLSITGPLAFALLGRALLPLGAMMAAVLIRVAMVGTAYAWWTLPAEHVLNWFAIGAAVSAAAAGLAVRRKPGA